MTNLLGSLLLLGALTGASAAQAHDFFLMPERFKSSGPGTLTVSATVGSSFPAATSAVTADRVDRLFARGAGQPSLTIAGAGATTLNLRLAGATRGMAVSAVKTKDRDVEYGEDRIPLILEEYRVSPVALAAIERLSKPRTLKVNSRRFAKTMVCVQTCGDHAAAVRPLGADLEFVAARGSADRFVLLGRGRPLGSYPVDVVTRVGKRRHLSTDARGELRLGNDVRGPLMLFAAVMTPPSAADRFTLDLSTLTLSRP